MCQLCKGKGWLPKCSLCGRVDKLKLKEKEKEKIRRGIKNAWNQVTSELFHHDRRMYYELIQKIKRWEEDLNR